MSVKIMQSVQAAAFFKIATYARKEFLDEVCTKYGIKNLKALGCTVKELDSGALLYEVADTTQTGESNEG